MGKGKPPQNKQWGSTCKKAKIIFKFVIYEADKGDRSCQSDVAFNNQDDSQLRFFLKTLREIPLNCSHHANLWQNIHTADKMA